MSWLLPVFGGLVLLYLGADALIKGACSLALRLEISPMVVGLTIVAFGTSVPELVVSLSAALDGANDIAVGNVVGSNVANLALILGFAAVLKPARVEAQLLRIDAPLLVLVSIGVVALLGDGTLTRLEGGLLLAAFVAYTGFTFTQGRKESAPVQEEFACFAEAAKMGLAKGVLGFVAGSIGLVIGGRLFVIGAMDLATVLGVNQATIGLSVVALGTSLPEFATAMIAVRRGHGDIAVGNAIGSNLFNLLGILGITSVTTPLVRGEVGWTSFGVMVGLAILVFVMLFTQRLLSRIEGAVLVATYFGYLVWLGVAATSAGHASELVHGTLEDDYGVRHTITDSAWAQHPADTYRVEHWRFE